MRSFQQGGMSLASLLAALAVLLLAFAAFSVLRLGLDERRLAIANARAEKEKETESASEE
jgi:hypothetical protein